MTYPNEAMDEVCKLLLDEYELTADQIANLAKDLPRECAGMSDNRAEAAWMDRQQSLMESGGGDAPSYRRNMIEAGRGHLLR